MVTIEERAKAFCEKNICVNCGDRKDCDRKCLSTCIPTYDAFEWLIQFGKSEHAELTRWHDPKEPPERGKDVLLKLRYEADAEPSYTVGYWNGTYYGDVLGADAEIIGWREVHE